VTEPDQRAAVALCRAFLTRDREGAMALLADGRESILALLNSPTGRDDSDVGYLLGLVVDLLGFNNGMGIRVFGSLEAYDRWLQDFLGSEPA
jgi:hypothetical protein